MAPAVEKVPPSDEWAPLTALETGIFAHCVSELGPDLRGLPDDLVTMLVRGYVNEKDAKGETVAHMIETADWRKENEIESALLPAKLPANRADFERMWKSSVIGEDVNGHLIVYEAVGKIPSKEFAAAFTGAPEKEANFLEQCAFNKEILRKMNIVKSNLQQKRVYKMIVIIDLAGLGMSHLTSTFINALKTYISKFSNLYPESLYKLFVINSPYVFTGSWSAISLFVHPVTRAKINICTNPKYALEELAKLGAAMQYKFEEVLKSAPPLSSIAPSLQSIPPPFNQPGETRPRK